MKHDVIVALDFPSAADVYAFLDQFNCPHASHGGVALPGEQSGLMPRHKSSGFVPYEKPFVKIGMELFYAEGPDIVRRIKARGHKIFLDLKLHDIPNTVKSAMRVLSRLDVDMVNVHAAGTVEMMRAALEGLTREDGSRPLLLAVTQLTSTSEERMHKELLIPASMPETVAHYARNAKEAGLDGVVCSPLEAALVKAACGPDFAAVTPGIRFSDSAADDQSRVMTPEKARMSGSDYIVVGRPITRAADPVAAYRRCVREFLGE